VTGIHRVDITVVPDNKAALDAASDESGLERVAGRNSTGDCPVIKAASGGAADSNGLTVAGSVDGHDTENQEPSIKRKDSLAGAADGNELQRVGSMDNHGGLPITGAGSEEAFSINGLEGALRKDDTRDHLVIEATSAEGTDEIGLEVDNEDSAGHQGPSRKPHRSSQVSTLPENSGGLSVTSQEHPPSPESANKPMWWHPHRLLYTLSFGYLGQAELRSL